MSGENTSKVRLMTVWVTCQDVRRYALVKWDSLNYATNTPFASENDFDQFLSGTLIPRAQAHINAFCRRDFDLDYLSGIYLVSFGRSFSIMSLVIRGRSKVGSQLHSSLAAESSRDLGQESAIACR